MPIKCSERNHRKGEIDSIDLASVQEDAPIPTLIEKFWLSASNKENLQLLIRQVALTKFDNVVLSSMFIDDELVNSFHQAPISTSVDELDSWEEEADNKVISHAMWAINRGAKRLIGLSNDCDTLMLLLWYMERFIENGSKEFWLQYGGGERKRMIPVHSWCNALGTEWCKTLLKIHNLTGNDFVSTVGSKLAAIKCSPLTHVNEFGECAELLDHQAALTEKYLVSVWNGVRSKTTAVTFDEFRLEYDRKSPAVPLE